MGKRWGFFFQLHLKNHLILYVFSTVLFMMGVIFGAVIVNALTELQKQDLLVYLSQFFNELNKGVEGDSRAAFVNTAGHYFKYLGLIWILGLSIIGLPLILVFIFLKGLAIGFSVSFLVSQLSWNGLWFAFVSIVPQNLIIVPALIIIGVAGISFSFKLMKNQFSPRRGTLSQHFVSYTTLVLVMGILFLVATLFESFVSPKLMQSVMELII
ncbi:stage II sporulation protein M [Microaerobacter geothermalis]|uniref:stage II sporulation protein M n=1 Tax=Microaerobacter geothermalis TaxID=674972 RepID=UPI001F1F4722|nr:stage II sporulation protein M [Microaerobacter geothermalis]MCF6093463.1 stage II sporulation protein M [Microaerobacter geothermalis]